MNEYLRLLVEFLKYAGHVVGWSIVVACVLVILGAIVANVNAIRNERRILRGLATKRHVVGNDSRELSGRFLREVNREAVVTQFRRRA